MSLEITKRVEFDAPREVVWHAITDPSEIATWFPDRDADFEPTPGYVGAFVWELDDSDCGGGSFAVRVEKAEPYHTLVWSWANESGTSIDEGLSTRVEWKLSERAGGGTVLELRETGFENLKQVELNNGGWDSELGELVSRLEKTQAEARQRTA